MFNDEDFGLDVALRLSLTKSCLKGYLQTENSMCSYLIIYLRVREFVKDESKDLVCPHLSEQF